MKNMERRSCTAITARVILGVALVFTGVLLSGPQAFGVAFRLPNQDPDAIARGNAFVATADNPSAIYYNPAGITQLRGQQFQAGLYLVQAGIEHESTSGIITENDAEFQPVPQLYYAFTPEDWRVSFGFGIYAPYGLGIKYPDDSTFRTIAKEGNLLYASMNPVVAWQIHPTLSIAAGPTLNYSKVNFQQGLTTFFDDEFEFEGDAFGVGFNAGIRWQPHEKWAFGINYRYTTVLDYEGDAEIGGNPFLPSATTDGSAEFTFPQFVVVGVSYRPTPKWNLEANVDWTDWDNVNQIVFEGTPLGDLTFPLHYRSSYMYEFGVTRYLSKGFHVSLGYFFSENSIPDRTFNPIVPDDDLHLGSFGVGYRGTRWSFSLAYHFGYNGERKVEGSQPAFPTTETADGLYRILNHAVNLSARFKF
jgi:long-chain fatty acid transport protein